MAGATAAAAARVRGSGSRGGGARYTRGRAAVWRREAGGHVGIVRAGHVERPWCGEDALVQVGLLQPEQHQLPGVDRDAAEREIRVRVAGQPSRRPAAVGGARPGRRRISSTARGTSAGSRASAARAPGLASSSTTPLSIAATVVSCPAKSSPAASSARRSSVTMPGAVGQVGRVVRPAAETLPIRGGHAEQLADDERGEREGERLVEIDRRRLPAQGIEEAVDQRLHAGAQARHAPDRERGGEQPPQPPVVAHRPSEDRRRVERAARSGAGWDRPSRGSASAALTSAYAVTSHAGSPAGVVTRRAERSVAIAAPSC